MKSLRLLSIAALALLAFSDAFASLTSPQVVTRAQLAGYTSTVAASIVNAQDVENGAVSFYLYVSSSNATADGVNVIIPSNSPSTGRWILQGTQLNLKTQGAKGDTVTGFVDGTINVGSNAHAFSSASANFASTDVGKLIVIDGAGVSHAPLVTTIATVIDSHDITITDAATNSVPYSVIPAMMPVFPETVSANYSVGATLTCVGGTGTACTAIIDADYVASATVNAGGSGGTNGTCDVIGTTGTALGGNRFSAHVTISGGAITAVSYINNQPGGNPLSGFYTTDIPNKAQEPVTGCGLTGAKLAVKTGPALVHVVNQGLYTVTPGSTFSITSSDSGAGVTMSAWASYNPTPFKYGTDDTGAWNAAIGKIMADRASNPVKFDSLYVPPGIYSVTPNAPTLLGSTAIFGDGHFVSQISVNPNTAGDLIGCSGCEQRYADPFNSYMMLLSAGHQNSGLTVKGLGIFGDRSSTQVQHAITLYDHSARSYFDDLEIDYMRGHAISTGTLKNDTVSDLIEAWMGHLRFFNDGDTNIPVLDLNSQGGGDGDNEIDFSDIDIYSPHGVGVAIRNNGTGFARLLRFSNLRIEGMEDGATQISAPLLQIGDTTEAGLVGLLTFTGSDLENPHIGQSALLVEAPASASNIPYGIAFRGDITGGAPYGVGLDIEAGFSNKYEITGIYSYDYNIKVGPDNGSGGNVGHTNYLNGFGDEATWSYKVDASVLHDGFLVQPLTIAGLSTQQSTNGVLCVGYNACASLPSTAIDGSAFGVASGQLETGNEFAFHGPHSGQNVQAGSNTAFGSYAMTGVFGNPLTGTENHAEGDYACTALQGAATTNTCVGYNSGSAITTGTGNTCIGANSCPTLSTGSGNFIVGPNADVRSANDFAYGSIDKMLLFDAYNGNFNFGTGLGAPVVSSCGTSPGTPAGSNIEGHVTVGTGTVPTCVLNFSTGSTHSATPDCWASDDTTLQTLKCVATSGSPGTITISATTTMAGDKIKWLVFGL